jgi:hypothetical protein
MESPSFGQQLLEALKECNHSTNQNISPTLGNERDEPIGSCRDENSDSYKAKCQKLIADFLQRKILTEVDGGLRRAVKFVCDNLAEANEELAQAKQKLAEHDEQGLLIYGRKIKMLQDRNKELESEVARCGKKMEIQRQGYLNLMGKWERYRTALETARETFALISEGEGSDEQVYMAIGKAAMDKIDEALGKDGGGND